MAGAFSSAAYDESWRQLRRGEARAFCELQAEMTAALSSWLEKHTALPRGQRDEVAERAFWIVAAKASRISHFALAFRFAKVVVQRLARRAGLKARREQSFGTNRLDTMTRSSADSTSWVEFTDQLEKLVKELDSIDRKLLDWYLEIAFSVEAHGGGRKKKTLKALAEELNLSERTLRRHLGPFRDKLRKFFRGRDP
jgi:AraC-like DNA-binding protein